MQHTSVQTPYFCNTHKVLRARYAHALRVTDIIMKSVAYYREIKRFYFSPKVYITYIYYMDTSEILENTYTPLIFSIIFH